jgi:hypothetical protein
MAIDKQTAALREAVIAPLMKAADLLKRDIPEADREGDGTG